MRFLKLPFIYWLLLNCIPFIGFELHSGNIKPGVFFYLGALTIITSGIWLFFCLYFFIKHNTSPNPHQTTSVATILPPRSTLDITDID